MSKSFLEWWQSDSCPTRKYYEPESVSWLWENAQNMRDTGERGTWDCRTQFEKQWEELPHNVRSSFKSVDHAWWIWRAGWSS